MSRPLSHSVHLGPAVPDAFAHFQDAVSAIHAVSLPAGSDPACFAIDAGTYQLPNCMISHSTGSAINLDRSADYITRHPVDQVSLFLLRSGHSIADYDGRHFEMNAGDAVFIDYMRPLSSQSTDFSAIALVFNRNAAPAAFQTGALHGAILPADRPAARMLSSQMTMLLETIEHLTVKEAQAAVEAILLFANAAWAEAASTDATSNDAALFDRAVRMIATHLGDAELSPESLAIRLGLSRTTLYRLFASKGGVTTSIRRMRLDGSLTALLELPERTRLVADVSRRFGFRSESQFSRAFRRRFGLSPSDALAMTHRGTDGKGWAGWLKMPPDVSGYDTVDAWLHSILQQNAHNVAGTEKVDL